MHPNEVAINQYVDNTLGDAERRDVEHHLEGCASCRALVDDLRALAQATHELRPVDPPAGVWRRIEKELKQTPAASSGSAASAQAPWRRRDIPRVAWWLAAAAALVLATIVGLRFAPASRRGSAVAERPDATSVPPGVAVSTDGAQTVEAELRQAEEHYVKAINGLEQIASSNQSALDPNTAATLHKNLAVIDQAINESRAAVRAQPTSEPAQQSLLENFRTKIAVLQDTVALINEMRKGNEAGAAQIVSGLKQKGD